MPFAFSDTEKRTIGKTDNVKTSPNRQVKAQPSRTFFRSALPFLLFFLGNMNAAEELLLRKTERSRTDADLIFVNGNIYTLNEKQPHAEAIAVNGNRIVFVGSNEEAKKFHAARVIDLHGHTVVPGVTDSHCHIFGIGEREMQPNLEGTNSLEDFLAKVKQRAAQTESGKWITGRGWIETLWKPPQFPTRNELDRIAPENPVYLTRADGHASVVNSAALKIAKIDDHTPDPFKRRAKRHAARQRPRSRREKYSEIDRS